MQELRVVGNENGALVVSNDAGESFRVVADDALFAEVRRLGKRDSEQSKVSPRIIQSHIRAGRTHEEITKLTGATVSDIERYEGPVLAERSYILDSALQVSVVLNTAEAELEHHTFGDALNIRLDTLSASNREWSSWRDDEQGWLVQLTFVANDVSHNATWQFDHKRLTLTPLSSEAITLSKQGDVGDRLIPKLRAVDSPNSPRTAGRFDSDAFDADLIAEGGPSPEGAETASGDDGGNRQTKELLQPESHWSQGVEELAVSRADDPADFGQTSDLLEALRRRRGERESLAHATAPEPDRNNLMPIELDDDPNATPLFDVLTTQAYDFTTSIDDDPNNGIPVTGIRGSDSPLSAAAMEDQPMAKVAKKSSAKGKKSSADEESGAAETAPAATKGRRKRAEMPSWDDILFGSRSEEDPV